MWNKLNMYITRRTLVSFVLNRRHEDPRKNELYKCVHNHSQVENFVVFWRPVGVLFRDKLSLLVGQVGAHEVDLDKRLEGGNLGGLEVVGGDNCKNWRKMC